MTIRNITVEDYIGYTNLTKSHISEETYNDFINNVLGRLHIIMVIEKDKKIIGTGTLFIEKKMTYDGCSMGHIENILIDDDYRGQGFGEKLVYELLDIAKKRECYRVDLNCNNELERFYQKNGFHKKHICMNVYFKENFS